MKIAVDAMGGDFGPAVVVEGAVAAVREFGLASVLVGDRAAIEREIARLGAQDLPITVRHASQVVGMAEAPSQALRRKRDSSLRVAAELVQGGRVRRARLGRQHRRGHGHRHVRHGRAARASTGPAIAARPAEPLRLHGPARRRRQRRSQAAAPLPVRGDGPRLLPRHRRQGQPARRAPVGRRGGGQGQRADQGGLRGAARLVAQLHRQRRGARHLQRPLRRGGDRRLHRQRLPQGLREPGRDADRDDPGGARARRPLDGGRGALQARPSRG